MATSGTVDQTRIDVVSVIDHAFRRCGKLAATVSGELVQSAKENLFLILTDLSNRGLSLFCVEKYVLGTESGKLVYALPSGLTDVLNVNYRTADLLQGTPLAQGIDLATAQTVSTVGLRFAADAELTLAYETSSDNLSWVTRYSVPVTTSADAWVYQDVERAPAARYWRVRTVSGVQPALSTLEFRNNPRELTMSSLNRDDYVAQPNKSALSSRALEYWFDKQVAPQLWVWPGTNNASDQIVVWAQHYIQDVGALSNELALPSRWLESVILTLACRCALEIPATELPPNRLEFLTGLASEHLTRAEAGESDGSPIRLQPNIRGYTR